MYVLICYFNLEINTLGNNNNLFGRQYDNEHKTIDLTYIEY